MGKCYHSELFAADDNIIRTPYINLLENLIFLVGKSQFTSCYPQPNLLNMVSFYEAKDT